MFKYTLENIRIKDNNYFHQKDNLMNSRVHSSAKMLKYCPPPEEVLPRKQKSEGGKKVRVLQFQSLRRLEDRRNERKQYMSSQLSEEPAMTVQSRPARPNLAELPLNKIELLISKKKLKREQEFLTTMRTRTNDQQQQKFRERKNRLRLQLKSRRAATTTLEHRSGVYKVHADYPSVQSYTTRRIQELAIPRHSYEHDLMTHSDTRGLLIRNHIDNLNRINRNKKIKHITNNPQHSPEPPHCQGFDNGEIMEHELDLREFHRKFGEVKGRVGFPKIHLENFMQKKLF